MTRIFVGLVCVLLLSLVMPANAQTRVWLDRTQITYGETATLNIETDQSVQQVDYRPLQLQFDVGGQTVRRSFQRVNGTSRTISLFAVGIRPRGPGVITVPALQVGNAATQPLRLVVLPPSVLPASGDADVFVETVVDAAQPYVQQAVGMIVRLHVAVPLLSGQLDQDDPANASLQRVGEDLQYQREIDGRRYSVVERRYLLIPERSGPLVIPGARFNGQAVGGFFDDLFGDGRKPLSAAAPLKRLQVRQIPADAPQPWLPLHDLKLRYVEAPRSARVGEALSIELEAIADGASASQLPPLTIPDSSNAQVFADPAQIEEQFIDGRPRTTVRRRIIVVPLREGALALPGPRIDWWDAAQGVARTAMLPPLQLQVGASTTATTTETTAQAEVEAGNEAKTTWSSWKRQVPWWLLGLGVITALAWQWRTRAQTRPVVATQTPQTAPEVSAPSLADALKQGDLAVIAWALSTGAGVARDDLDGVRAHLDNQAQREAIAQLQASRWGNADAGRALVALRNAFAKGARWRKWQAKPAVLLPPLYPEA